MKQYKVTVNGKIYDVVVEEISSTPIPHIPEVGLSKPQPQAISTPSTKVSDTSTNVTQQIIEGCTLVKAPMPGKVLSFNVSVGDKVSEGDVILILEAMKMENEINAPISGIVKAINVSKGGAVVVGDILLQIG